MKHLCLSITIASLLLTGFIFGKASTQPSEEKFVPDNLREAKLVACGVGGNVDGTSDSIVKVEFAFGGKPYTSLIARRAALKDSIQDCQVWFSHVQEKWQTVKKGIVQ